MENHSSHLQKHRGKKLHVCLPFVDNGVCGQMKEGYK